MRRALSTTLLLLTACPAALPPLAPDAGVDAGRRDAGAPVDAGRPRPDAGAPDAGWVQVPIDAWCAARALAECRREVRCQASSAANLAACVARNAQRCDGAGLTRSAAEGRLSYLPTEGAKCLDAFEQGPCSGEPAACAALFVGLQPADAGCLVPEDCNPEQGFCDTFDNLCPHRCSAWRASGESCDGFFRRCRPQLSTCRANDAGLETCQAPLADGEACAYSDDCREGRVCVSGTCVQRVAAEGEECNRTSGFPFCEGDFFCRVAAAAQPGVCTRRAGLGGACSGQGSCLATLRCSSQYFAGVCTARLPTGAACSAYDDCEEGQGCPSATSRCTPVPGAGGDCSAGGSQYSCAPGAYCDFSDPTGQYACRATLGLGEACGGDYQCISGDCLYGRLPDAGFGGQCQSACAARADGGF